MLPFEQQLKSLSKQFQRLYRNLLGARERERERERGKTSFSYFERVERETLKGSLIRNQIRAELNYE